MSKKNKEQTDHSVRLVGELRFFTPIEIDGNSFGVGIYYSQDGIPHVNATDFFGALGVKKYQLNAGPDNVLYKWINDLDLQVNEDYVVRQGKDPIIGNPEHIFTLTAAYKIAGKWDDPMGEVAMSFFDAIQAIDPSNIFQLLAYDILIRNPLFTLEKVAYVFGLNGYDDGELTEENLIKLLQHDRLLTKAMNPGKGYESVFVKARGKTLVTPYGFNFLIRRYMGFTVEATLGCMSEFLPQAERLVSDSIFEQGYILSGENHE